MQVLLRLIFSISLLCDYGKLEAFHFAFVKGQILDGHLDKPGPVGVGEVWTSPQRLWLEIFPKHTTLLRYKNDLPLSFPS